MVKRVSIGGPEVTKNEQSASSVQDTCQKAITDQGKPKEKKRDEHDGPER